MRRNMCGFGRELRDGTPRSEYFTKKVICRLYIDCFYFDISIINSRYLKTNVFDKNCCSACQYRPINTKKGDHESETCIHVMNLWYIDQ